MRLGAPRRWHRCQGARARQSDQAGCKNAARAEVTLEMQVLLAVVQWYVRRTHYSVWDQYWSMQWWERKRGDKHPICSDSVREYSDDHRCTEHAIACVCRCVYVAPMRPKSKAEWRIPRGYGAQSSFSALQARLRRLGLGPVSVPAGL